MVVNIFIMLLEKLMKVVLMLRLIAFLPYGTQQTIFKFSLTYDDIDDQTDVRPVSCFTQPGELFAVIGQPIATECNGGSDSRFS